MCVAPPLNKETHIDGAKQKLQPFFPPLEPLQSLNLRAALYRSLNDLKKNGLLGRETILRKTMLDECKGDKLMEVLAVFSTAVLRRAHQVHVDASACPSVASTLATATMLDAVKQGSLIPLSVAYSASLSTNLRKKEGKKARIHQFSELLDVKGSQLDERLEFCTGSKHRPIDATDEAQIKKILHENWPGHSRWPQVVLYGDEVNTGDLPLQRPFQEVWSAASKGDQLPVKPNSSGLLESLERRVSEQSTRLRRWHDFHNRFLGSNPDAASQGATDGQQSSAPAFNFGKHRHLRLGKNISVDYLGGLPPSASAYQTILASLAKDLADASRCRRNGGTGWSMDRSNTTTVRVDDHAIFSPVKASTMSTSHIIPSGLGTQPNFAPETTLREKIDDHDDHDDNNFMTRERSNTVVRISDSTASTPIPASTASSIQPQSAPLEVKPLLMPEIILPAPTKPADPPSAADVPGSAALRATLEDLQDMQPDPPQEDLFSGSTSSASLSSSSEDDDPAEQIISSVVNSSPSPLRPFTLAERTRMSMAHSVGPKLPRPAELLVPVLSRERDVPGVEITNRRASLLERTQQTMANIPANGITSRKNSSRKSNRQSLFPVNQFETPGKVRAHLPDPKRDATPTEKLFSEDAEYTSVFKSRPKIALSPVWSPDVPDTPAPLDESLDSDDDVQDEVWGSSPLANRRGIAH
jgi:hypothetical protein